MKKSLTPIAKKVEADLSQYYGFEIISSVTNHFVSDQEIHSNIPETDTEQAKPRGSVWVVNDTDDEMFVGVNIAEEVTQNLESKNPLESLHNENLEDFSILVEEISHFHLILNRATQRLEVSQVELEYQGEMDKLLISAMLLQEQCGDPHIIPLARKLYDNAIIVAQDKERYWEATKHAARFWFQTGDINLWAIQEKLRKIYFSSWQEKTKICA